MTKLYYLPKLFLLLLLLMPAMAKAQVYATTQTNGVTGLCLLCGVSNPNNAVNNSNLTDYSTLNITAGLLGVSVYQTLIFPTAGGPCDSLVLTLGSSDAVLSANIFGGVTVQTFNGNTPNNDAHVVDSSSIRLLQNNTLAQVVLHPGQNFDRVKVTLSSGILGLLNSLNIYYAYRNAGQPAAPVFNTPSGFVCGQQTLSIQNYAANTRYDVHTVYKDLFGNPLKDTAFSLMNTPYVPVQPYFNFSYTQTDIYITAVNPFTGCKSDSIHGILFFGGAGAKAQTDADTVVTCKGQPVTLHGYLANNTQANIRWYNAATGGSLLYTGNYYTVSPDTTTTYYVTTGFVCEYPVRVPVTVIVNKLPAPVFSLPTSVLCGDILVPVQNYQAGISYKVRVIYNEDFGPVTDTSYVISNSANVPVKDLIGYRITNAIITLQATNAAGCLSDSVSGSLYFGGHAAYPSTDTDSVAVCLGDSTTLHAFIPGTTTPQVRWYDAATGGNLLATGNYYTVSPAATRIYYVTSAFACEYPLRRPVRVQVNNCIAKTMGTATNVRDGRTMQIEELQLYPNPSAGMVRVNNLKDPAGAQLSIFDGGGNLLRTFNLRNSTFTLTERPGIYLIKIQTRDGVVYTGKIILQ
ncbi:T9SS type A sorting domain-containing protein [Chitinophaga sp. Hz27]|uniref:Ig-like domain-containing protein n=1 Tax=Chitinophaga sp. Hz27 TaxID=3347169 RepID=UPI0035D8C825